MVSLGGGRKAPYPTPSSPSASAKAKANRRNGSKSERAVRSEVHRRGLRFRVDHPVQAGNLKVRPDLVFTKAKVAVFIDGCFWHRCPRHGSQPKSNQDYWLPKLESNVSRDRRIESALEDGGWKVLSFWEHEDSVDVAQAVFKAWNHGRSSR